MSYSLSCIHAACIRDIMLAIGAKNWDCETTIPDVTRAAISKVVNASTLDELAEGIEDRLTRECRRQLRRG